FPHLPARAEAPPPAQPAAVATRRRPADGSSKDTAVLRPVQTQVDWRSAPPPVRVPPAEAVTAELAERTPVEGAPAAANGPPPPALAAPPADPAAPPQPAQPAQAPQPQPADRIFEMARPSPEARRGLGTRRALYRRILTTRRLLRAWNRAGKYLARPKRKPA